MSVETRTYLEANEIRPKHAIKHLFPAYDVTSESGGGHGRLSKQVVMHGRCRD